MMRLAHSLIQNTGTHHTSFTQNNISQALTGSFVVFLVVRKVPASSY